MKNNTFVRAVSRVLIAGLIWLPLQAQAGDEDAADGANESIVLHVGIPP